MLQDPPLVEQESDELRLLKLHQLDQQRVLVLIQVVHISTALDKPLGQLLVELLSQQHVHQDSHAVLILLVDAVRIQQHQYIQRCLIVVLCGKHHRCKTLTVLDLKLFFSLHLIEDGGQYFLLLVSNR